MRFRVNGNDFSPPFVMTECVCVCVCVCVRVYVLPLTGSGQVSLSCGTLQGCRPHQRKEEGIHYLYGAWCSVCDAIMH